MFVVQYSFKKKGLSNMEEIVAKIITSRTQVGLKEMFINSI